jgi:hypothetical protein
MRANLSILGLYNYDTSIFENLTLPDELDAATAIDSIVFDNAELEIMYPEPDTMKYLIGLWSRRETPIWKRMYDAMQLEYNPIENYNRSETWTDSETEETEANTETSGTNTNQVAGFNSEEFTNKDKGTGTGTEAGSGSRETSSTHTGNVSGNIGVTTSQQMLQQELDIAPKLEIYKVISESFKKRFCLMVY